MMVKKMINVTIVKKHFHIVHDGYKDYKCKYCGKLFQEEDVTNLIKANYLNNYVFVYHNLIFSLSDFTHLFKLSSSFPRP